MVNINQNTPMEIYFMNKDLIELVKTYGTKTHKKFI